MIKKVCASLWKLTTLFKTGIKTKKIHQVLEFNQSQWQNSTQKKSWIQHTKKNRSRKNSDKDVETFQKLMNAAHGKTFQNLRNIIDVRLVSN